MKVRVHAQFCRKLTEIASKSFDHTLGQYFFCLTAKNVDEMLTWLCSEVLYGGNQQRAVKIALAFLVSVYGHEAWARPLGM